jgi:type 1 glutamine amidotransferase/sugar phosphate isomerase/epimerase
MDLYCDPRGPLPAQPALALTRRAFLARTATGALALGCSPPLLAAAPATAPASERELVEAAIPTRALATPRKPRKLLIFDRNVNYGGHPSILTANLAFELMGRKTGAFDTVVSRDPEVFRPESLRQFDAVFFNNCVGNLFTDPALRQSLAEFVYRGGGMMGVHGTTVAFTQWPGGVEDWPEFGLMIGARGANHRANDEHVFIKLDDHSNPLTGMFGRQGFDYRDEFFRPGDPYSRKRVRVLLSIDTDKTDLKQGRGSAPLERADNDFALAWVRNYGRGRTFYCTIAHNPYVFRDPKMLPFYLAAAQFVLGDLPAPTTPSAMLTPAIRAQEKLGWRLGLEADTFPKLALFEAIEKTAALGVPYLGGLSSQRVSDAIPKSFAPGLSDDELRQIRFKLDAAGVRLLTYDIPDLPGDAAGCSRVFEFGRKIGIETIIAAPKPDALNTIEKFCDACETNVALCSHDAKASPAYWNPKAILKACAGRSQRLGAAADLGYWLMHGFDPVRAVNELKGRLITVRLHDLSKRGAGGHDVGWGTGVGKTAAFLKEVRRLGIQPTMFGLEYSPGLLEAMPDLARCVTFFNNLTLELAKGES